MALNTCAHHTGFALRGQILHCLSDPSRHPEAMDRACEYFADGLLWVQDGHIQALGAADALLPQLPDTTPVECLPHHLMVPGFIDAHVHYPQTGMIGAHGSQLLDWLENHTFPTEQQFADHTHATAVAQVFLDELLRNGTTTALVFATVHPASVDAFFQQAQARGLRMITGKVMMDRNAPAALCDTPESAYADSRALIQRWHGVDRLQYAVTPRFAPTSSEAQLHKAADLLAEFPDVYLHTHLAENREEVAWVKRLFPQAHDYLAVYEQAGLLGRRSLFAHGVHLCDDQCRRLAAQGAAVVHCPTSNLFLGSGLFDLPQAQRHRLRIALGTDVGAGTSFSLLRTLDEACKIQQVRGTPLDPHHAFYLATLGGATALDLDNRIGNLQPGKEADFAVLDLQATPLLQFRSARCQSLSELLSVLYTLGDDRVIERTYALGRCVHRRQGNSSAKPSPNGTAFNRSS